MSWINVDVAPMHVNTGRGKRARELTARDRESLEQFVRQVRAMVGSASLVPGRRGGKHRASPVTEGDA